ncbi:MAG: YihY/virulence factor BrkB family protein [Thermoleophilaceae bacterium]
MARESTREDRAGDRGHDRRDGPDSPAGLSSKGGVLKRAGKGFMADNLTDWAAALTYYGILSIFPALLAAVSILGLIGGNTLDNLLQNVEDLAPGPARDLLSSALENLQGSSGAATLVFVASLAGAIWAASGYVAAFVRASNSIYEIGEGRPLYKTLGLRVGITVAMLALLALLAIGVTVTGPLAEEVGSAIGVGDTAVTIWEIAKWPVLVILVSFMFAFLYWAAPNVKQPGFRWISPGGLVAVVLWIVASLAFAFYVASFSSYNATYGAVAGVIVFLIWLWITNLAILFGAELNAELERGRRIDAGHVRPGEEPFVEPRDTKKLDDDQKRRYERRAE